MRVWAAHASPIHSLAFAPDAESIYLTNPGAGTLAVLDRDPSTGKTKLKQLVKHEEGAWTATIEIKGDECIYLNSHDSGHFGKFVWKKGVGLVEHSSGYGAMKDGFRLKRASSKN